MSIFKRGTIYWYKFTFNGEAIRKSSRQKNQNLHGKWKPPIVWRSRKAKSAFVERNRFPH